MISIYNEAQDFPEFGKIKAICLSTDTKPTTGILTGEKLLELDTGKTYVFSNENVTWYEIQGGGDVPGQNSYVIINLNAFWDEDDSVCRFTSDMELSAIEDLINDNVPIKGVVHATDTTIQAIDGTEITTFTYFTALSGSRILAGLGIVGDLTPSSATRATGNGIVAYFQDGYFAINYTGMTLTQQDFPASTA